MKTRLDLLADLVQLASAYHPDNVGKFDLQIEAKNKALEILREFGLLDTKD